MNWVKLFFNPARASFYQLQDVALCTAIIKQRLASFFSIARGSVAELVLLLTRRNAPV